MAGCTAREVRSANFHTTTTTTAAGGSDRPYVAIDIDDIDMEVARKGALPVA